MSRTRQLNIRLSTDVHAILNQISEENNIAPTTLASQILSDYAKFYYYKIHRGDITISQHILQKYFEGIAPEYIEDMSNNVADYIISEMKSQEGKINYDILSQRILKWNKGNHLILNKFSNKDSEIFIAKHELGGNWSKVQCATYSKAFDKIGESVMEQDSDECSYSIEIAKHKD